MTHDEARVLAALDRLADVASQEGLDDTDLDAAVEGALRTPGVAHELLRRPSQLKARRSVADDEPAA